VDLQDLDNIGGSGAGGGGKLLDVAEAVLCVIVLPADAEDSPVAAVLRRCVASGQCRIARPASRAAGASDVADCILLLGNRAAPALETVASDYPGVAIVAVVGPELADPAPLLQRGASDVVPASVDAEGLLLALRVAAARGEARRRSQARETEAAHLAERLSLAQRAGRAGLFDWRIAAPSEVYVSPEYCDLYGLSPDAVVSFASWLASVHPEDRERMQQAADAMLAEGGHFVHEFRIVHPVRGLRWIRDVGEVERDARGQAVRFSGVALDITAQKSIEQQLRRSEARLRMALEAAGLYSYEWDLDQGTLVRLSAEPDRLAADDGEPIAALVDYVHSEDWRRFAAALDAARGDPALTFACELRVNLPGGEQRWLDHRGRLECDAVTGSSRLIGVAIDVTERKRGEEHARFLDRISRLLGEASDPAVVVPEVLGATAAAFAVDLVVLAEVSADGEAVKASSEWRDGHRGVLGTTHRFADFLVPSAQRSLADGETLVVDDVARDPRTSAHAGYLLGHVVAAFVLAPLLGEGRLRGTISVNASRPRRWRRDEITLLRALAARVFPSVDRLHALQQLRRSEMIYRKLAESNLFGVGFGDSQGRVHFVNDEMLRMMGRTRAELDAGAINWAEAIAPEFRATIAREAELLLEEGFRYGYEAAFLRPDGGRTPYLAGAAIVAPGEDLHVSIALDTTKIRRAEAQARESEERLRFALQAARAGTWRKDLVTGTVEWSDEMYRQYGLPPGDTPSWEAGWERIHPEDRSRMERELELFLAGSETEWRGEFRICRPGLPQRAILSLGRLERSADGQPLAMSGINLDVTELEQAREAERKGAALLHTVLASTTDLVWVKDREGRITQANDATFALLGGGDPSRVIGRGAHELISDERQAQVVMANDARIIAGGVAETVDEAFGPEEAPLVFQSVKAPLRDAKGAVVGLVGVSRNVTEARRAAARLARSEARLRLALDTADLLISESDAEADRLYLSPELAQRMQLPTEIALSDAWRHVHAEDRARLQRELGTASDGDLRFEHRMLMPEGERWVLARGRRDMHRPARILWVTQDITERKRNEEALAQREAEARQANERLAEAHRRLEESFALLDTLFDRAPIGLTFLDREYRFVRINSALAALNGAPVAAHIGRTVEAVLPEVWPRVRPLLERVRESGEAVVNVEVRGIVPGRRSTTEGWWLASYYPVHVRGELFGFGIVAIDVTEQKLTEEALREADQRKDTFLATLAHELRNPLAPIRNAVHVLRAAPAAADGARMLSVVDRQVTHMVRLIDDLLEVSRINCNKIELRLEAFDLVDAVAAAVEASRPFIETMAHAFVLDAAPEPMPLHADRIRVAQVISNLLNNAAKYTRRGGRITLTTRREAGEAVLSVSDNGVGIALEDRPALFRMFSQLGSESGRAQGGLGIGLWLVQQLVTMHGGRVAATSDGLGRGSTFTIRLPLAAGLVANHPEGGSKQVGNRSGLRILAVDDNVDYTETLRELLGLLGADVRTATDGASALSVALTWRPDLVLLDIGLPGIDGYEVCRQLRAQAGDRAPRIIAVTGWGQDADRLRSREAGFDAHLTKPVDVDALYRVMHG
jgi:PAS domain S-box-containing protein